MATIVHNSVPHEDRTASEPRQHHIESVTITHIREINATTRVLRLSPTDPNHAIKFLPGQWLDTFIPTIPKAGGFTITSPPSAATPKSDGPGYLELAVQNSSNPPARYFHRPIDSILDMPLAVRVGGSFTYPPPVLPIPTKNITRLVLIAGGVGINPLISILSHLIQLRPSQRPEEIHFLYGTKTLQSEPDPQSILFLPRLMDLVSAAAEPVDVTLSLFLTGPTGR
ncbi:hypothetical protein MBLNU13_g04198t1 [Cladosporium sp. NU13]